MRMRVGERGAVTLIDVLVMIAATLIIIAILQPFLGRRQYWRPIPLADCKANLSQVGKAIYQYAEANGEFYPCFVGRSASDSLALLYPDYALTADIFGCPKTADKPRLTIAKGRDRKIIDRRFGSKPEWSSYGYDAEISFRTATALQPIAADMDGSSVATPGSPTANHQEGQNVLFYDTHVNWNATNVWNNRDVIDNIFTKDHSDADADIALRERARDVADTDTYVRR